jgi:hypothetical protein
VREKVENGERRRGSRQGLGKPEEGEEKNTYTAKVVK